MDSMIVNAIELLLLGIAFYLSKYNQVPLALIAYNVSIQLMNWFNNQLYDGYNDTVMLTYVLSSCAMLIYASVFFLIWNRIALFTAFVVLIQALLESLAGMSVLLSFDHPKFSSLVFDAHFFMGNKFVILYVIIAWICVYYSRMEQYASKR